MEALNKNNQVGQPYEAEEIEKSISINELRLIELRGFLMGLGTLNKSSCYYDNFITVIDNILDKNNEEIRSSKYKLK